MVSTIDSLLHSYDKTINRTKTVEPTGTTKYTYDPVYRLIKTVLDTTATEKYTYDATGNRTTGPTVSTNYTIDLGNQLTAKTGVTFTYDGNGNITTKTEGATTYTYIYDGENRLIEVQNNGNTISTYKYDPFGRRIEKTVNGITTKYLYDGANILYEYDNANSITARYTHNLAIDEPLGIEKGDKLYAYHKDTLGSIRTITDSSQATINTYSYDSFGNTKQTGTLSQPYAYTSREWDKETGLYYYRARYYDPMAGRFIQKDPIGFRGGDVNLYGYVGGNPVNHTDPMGLATDAIPFPGTGAGVGVGTGAISTACGYLVAAGAIVALTPSSTSTCADYPPKDECKPKKDETCAEEMAACTRICSQARYDPDLRNVWGGSFGACMKGCLSKRCGGS